MSKLFQMETSGGGHVANVLHVQDLSVATIWKHAFTTPPPYPSPPFFLAPYLPVILRGGGGTCQTHLLVSPVKLGLASPLQSELRLVSRYLPSQIGVASLSYHSTLCPKLSISVSREEISSRRERLHLRNDGLRIQGYFTHQKVYPPRTLQ